MDRGNKRLETLCNAQKTEGRLLQNRMWVFRVSTVVQLTGIYIAMVTYAYVHNNRSMHIKKYRIELCIYVYLIFIWSQVGMTPPEVEGERITLKMSFIVVEWKKYIHTL